MIIELKTELLNNNEFLIQNDTDGYLMIPVFVARIVLGGQFYNVTREQLPQDSMQSFGGIFYKAVFPFHAVKFLQNPDEWLKVGRWCYLVFQDSMVPKEFVIVHTEQNLDDLSYVSYLENKA